MKCSAIFLFFFVSLAAGSSAQTIEGDQLLQLIGQPVSSPLFQQLKTQENFYTDHWDSKLSIYIVTQDEKLIREVELQNGKSTYGIYTRKLPLGMTWQTNRTAIEQAFGKPVLSIADMNLADYTKDGWTVRVAYDANGKPLSYNYSKPAVAATSPVFKSAPVVTNTAAPADKWMIRLDTTNKTASVNWPALQYMIISIRNLMPLTDRDSVDYIGQMYYATPYKVVGFKRSALMRQKSKNQWHFESFYKTSADSNTVRRIFFAVYNALKDAFKQNTGDEFILASTAKGHLSDKTVNWMAQWSLFSGYKGLVPGLPTVKVNFLLSGMQNVFRNNEMDYTLKLTVFAGDYDVDFFTWDKPL